MLNKQRVLDLPPEQHGVCDALLSALAADFSKMVRFLRANPRAKLGARDEAAIWKASNSFVVPVHNVVYCVMDEVARETALFGGQMISIDGAYFLSVPMPVRSSIWSTVWLILTSLLMIGVAVAAACWIGNVNVRAALASLSSTWYLVKQVFAAQPPTR